MRIVLDTNILARTILSPAGLASKLLERTRESHVLVLSTAITNELWRVLTYERVRRIHRLDDSELVRIVDELEAGCLLVQLPEVLPRVVPDDAGDDPVVATAVAGAANIICSKNLKHLAHPDVIQYCEERAIEVMDDVTRMMRLRGDETT